MTDTHHPDTRPKAVSDDLLDGAEAIARFLGLNRRQVYNLTTTSRLPHFRMAGRLYGRKSTLLRWIEEQETRTAKGLEK